MPAPINLARAIALTLAAFSTSTAAAQLDYTLYTGLEHTDNINLSASQPISQNVLIPGLHFAFNQSGAAVQAQVAGDLEYHDYLGNRFNDQTQAQLAGQARWTVAPQRLDLSVEDYAGIEPVDTLVSNAPSNLQQTNVLKLGPTLYFQPGDTLHGQVELRYIDSYAQKTTDFDSQRETGALRLLKDLSSVDVMSVEANVQRVNFPHVTGADYDRTELFGRYVSKLARFDVDAAIGWAKVDFRAAGRPAATSPLAQLMLDWRASDRSIFTLNAQRQYSDAAQDMILQPGMQTGTGAGSVTNGINTGNAVVGADVYLQRRLELGYAMHTERLTLSLAPYYRKLSYMRDATFDQVGRGAVIGASYRLRPALTVSALASGETLTYRTLDRRDRSTSYQLDLTDQWTPHWSWRASLLRQRRASNVPSQGFTENRIYFGVSYKR